MGAYLEGFPAAQAVQFGDRHFRGALRPHAITGGHGVKMANGPGASRGGAVFLGKFPQRVRLFLVHGRNKRPLAHTRGEGLDHSHHLVNVVAKQAAADRRIGGQGARGRRKRVDSEIQVAQGAQLSLEQNGFPLFGAFFEQHGRIGNIGTEPVAATACPVRHVLRGKQVLLAVKGFQALRFPSTDLLQAFAETLRIKQFSHLQCFLDGAIPIGRSNPPARGTISVFAEPVFFKSVLQAMEGKTDGGPVRNPHVGMNAARGKFVQLRNQAFQVNDHARAQDVDNLRIKDA
ncbi:MAG: hypothetical protein BWX80_03864 [Candidatus Hydrogenedentes bacterium ADurb.Bin101]|nr:MAG: hypothetical protein BWX80_03864 [Candidatus Hydrogenedentes bacterium ADurb.Bin101]